MSERIAETEDQKIKFNRANIAPELYRIFQDAQTKLQAYKVEVNFSQFSAFIVHFLPADVGQQFVEKEIPLQHRANDLMGDPDFQKELERLVKKHRSASIKT